MAELKTSRLTPEQIAAVAYNAGFRGQALTNAVAVALAESGGDPRAVGVNKDKWKSRDRGLWQINSHWHPDVSDADAFSPSRAAAHAYRISSQGKSWSPWATWPTAAALHMARATLATQRYQGSTSGATVTPVLGGWGLGDYLPDIPGPVDDWLRLGDDGLEKALPFAGGEALGFTADIGKNLAQMVVLMVSAGRWLSDAHNWARVAMVSGGGVALLLGAKMLAESGSLGEGVARTTKKASSAASSAAALAVTRKPKGKK